MSSLFSASENVLNYKIGTKMFNVAYRTLLVMFCVPKYYFVDFNGMFTSFQGCQIRQSENACALQSWENIIFQNKTFLVMFYRQNKTLWLPIF